MTNDVFETQLWINDCLIMKWETKDNNSIGKNKNVTADGVASKYNFNIFGVLSFPIVKVQIAMTSNIAKRK